MTLFYIMLPCFVLGALFRDAIVGHVEGKSWLALPMILGLIFLGLIPYFRKLK